MWHRWFWLNLPRESAKDTVSASLLIPSSAMAVVFITRCLSMVIFRQVPKIRLLPLLWGSKLIMQFGKSLTLMSSVLLLLGFALGIPAPTASAFAMKTLSAACLPIPAVTFAKWTDKAEMSREVMAGKPATKHSTCTVELSNVPEMKWHAVLLDTDAARTAIGGMPLGNMGQNALTNFHLDSATGAAQSASEETTLEFKFAISGPTHNMLTLVGGVDSLPVMRSNFWVKARSNGGFPSRTVKLGNEGVSFGATPESCAALVNCKATVKISAHLPRDL